MRAVIAVHAGSNTAALPFPPLLTRDIALSALRRSDSSWAVVG